MPTVLRLGPLRVVVYPNDHRPAHVHVIGDGCEAVFHLRCLGGVPELRENYGFSRQQVSRIERALNVHQVLLCEKWREIHGRP